MENLNAFMCCQVFPQLGFRQLTHANSQFYLDSQPLNQRERRHSKPEVDSGVIATSSRNQPEPRSPPEDFTPAPERYQSRRPYKPQDPYTGKQRGRPRKVPKVGLPDNFDSLPSKQQYNLLRLQLYGIIYASEKAEKEIALRMENGLALHEAREIVFTEIDAQNIRSGEKPTSGAIRTYLGIPRGHYYLPSVAAHSRSCLSNDELTVKIPTTKKRHQTLDRYKKDEQIATTDLSIDQRESSS